MILKNKNTKIKVKVDKVENIICNTFWNQWWNLSNKQRFNEKY